MRTNPKYKRKLITFQIEVKKLPPEENNFGILKVSSRLIQNVLQNICSYCYLCESHVLHLTIASFSVLCIVTHVKKFLKPSSQCPCTAVELHDLNTVSL